MNKASSIATLCCTVSLAAVVVVACSEETTSTPNTGDGGGQSSSGDASSGKVDSGNSSGGNVDSGDASSGGEDGVDGGGQDNTAACTAYCTCMASTCSAQMTQIGPDCLAACKAQTKWDLSCRRQHCTNAQGGSAATHCQHAIGQLGTCEDTQ